MSKHTLPNGTTWYDTGTAPWETDPKGWKVEANAEGGKTAAHFDWRDNLVPAGVAGIFGYGALSGLGAFGGGAAAGGGGAVAPSAAQLAALETTNAVVPASIGGNVGMFGSGSLANFFNSRSGTAAINAGSQLVGGAMNAHAQGRAADLQAKAAADALAFAKEAYAKAVKDYAPYMEASKAQIPGLNDFLNQTRPPQGGYPVNGQPPVLMRAPTGETKPIPIDQVPHYTARGAQVVS